MKTLQSYGPLGARALLALIFLFAGYGKLMDPASTAGSIEANGLPLPSLMAILAGVLEVGGAAMLLVGFRTRWGALALAAFLIPTTVIFHNPIGLEGMEAHMQTLQALKNLAIIGGLLSVAASGAGAFSLDAQRERRLVPQPA